MTWCKRQRPCKCPAVLHSRNRVISKLSASGCPGLDALEKIQGKAVFGMDVQLKGLLTATVVHPPVLGARVKSFEDSTAKSMPGVRHILPISSGIAVVADRFWKAKKAAEVLAVDWDLGQNADLSSDRIKNRWIELAKTSGRRCA